MHETDDDPPTTAFLAGLAVALAGPLLAALLGSSSGVRRPAPGAGRRARRGPSPLTTPADPGGRCPRPAWASRTRRTARPVPRAS
ncbi:hypothetical protein O2W18_19340 [Modestobacter sp. VKM Ac-2983]|uniref:hypothetical protein n=1 Tax=Modestobacter sp. VKM Ac-2983 TaxID=3004137 RepID=UPI0022AB89F4|nr:hypothetical protein [Modestobacter sp. VKM Ac-2983]MCZ2807269.1 hypothetical protein [Modestobacter sp. VKM Ac-2983]